MNVVTKKTHNSGLLQGASLAAALSLTALASAQTATAPASPTGATKNQTFALSSTGVTLNTPIEMKTGSFAPIGAAVCVEEPPLENFVQTGSFVSVPGFVLGEEMGVILNAPAAHYPIEILRVRIGWSSAIGGQPDSLEDSILIYPAGLPNPGVAQYSIGGPVLVDGAINEFDLTTAVGGVGSRIINSGPFMVSLKMANTQSAASPAPIHDGNGCQSGKNAIFASPFFTWFDACLLGVTGDWVVSVTYRQVNCTPPPACPSDLTLDGVVNAADLAQLLANWGACLPGVCPSDLTLDGVVNAADLAQLLANWGACP